MYSTRKKITDEAEAQALLEQFETYRGTFRLFCAEMDVDGRSLRAWQRRLIPEVPPGLLFVQLTAEAFHRDTTYRVSIDDVTIEISEDFNPQIDTGRSFMASLELILVQGWDGPRVVPQSAGERREAESLRVHGVYGRRIGCQMGFWQEV